VQPVRYVMIHSVRRFSKSSVTMIYGNLRIPARGTELWKQLYKERIAVERVNAYLKQNFYNHEL